MILDGLKPESIARIHLDMTTVVLWMQVVILLLVVVIAIGNWHLYGRIELLEHRP